MLEAIYLFINLIIIDIYNFNLTYNTLYPKDSVALYFYCSPHSLNYYYGNKEDPTIKRMTTLFNFKNNFICFPLDLIIAKQSIPVYCDHIKITCTPANPYCHVLKVHNRVINIH